jgi:hypothetical protein
MCPSPRDKSPCRRPAPTPSAPDTKKIGIRDRNEVPSRWPIEICRAEVMNARRVDDAQRTILPRPHRPAALTFVALDCVIIALRSPRTDGCRHMRKLSSDDRQSDVATASRSWLLASNALFCFRQRHFGSDTRPSACGEYWRGCCSPNASRSSNNP